MRFANIALLLLLAPQFARAADLRAERLDDAGLTMAVPSSCAAPTLTTDEDSEEWYWYNESPFLEVFLTAIKVGTPVTSVHIGELSKKFADQLRGDEAVIGVTSEAPLTLGGRRWESWTSRVASDPPVIATDYLCAKGDTALLLLVRYYDGEKEQARPLVDAMLQELKIDPRPSAADVPTSMVDFPKEGVRLPLPTGGELTDENSPDIEHYRASEAISPAAFWTHPALPWWWMLLQVIEVGMQQPQSVLDEYFPREPGGDPPALRTIAGRQWLSGVQPDESATAGGYEVEHDLTLSGGRLYMFAFMYVAADREYAQQQLQRFLGGIEFYDAPLTDITQMVPFTLGVKLHVSLPAGGDMDVPGDPDFGADEDPTVVGTWIHPASPVRRFRAVVKQVSSQNFKVVDDPLAVQMEYIGPKVAELVHCEYRGAWRGSPDGAVQTSHAMWHGFVLSDDPDGELVEFMSLGPGETADKFTLYIVAYAYPKNREAEAQPVIKQLLEKVKWD